MYATVHCVGHVIAQPLFTKMSSGREKASLQVASRTVRSQGGQRTSPQVIHRLEVEAPLLVERVVRPYIKDGTSIQFHGELRYSDVQMTDKDGTVHRFRNAEIVIGPGAAGGNIRMLSLPGAKDRSVEPLAPREERTVDDSGFRPSENEEDSS